MQSDASTDSLEMAAINMGSSQVLAEASHNANAVLEYQKQVQEKLGVVNDLKDVISEINPHEVTPENAVIIDKQLERQGALVSKLVNGTETLGKELSPLEWKLSRITACESLISTLTDFLETSAKVIVSSFQDAKVALLMTVKDSKSALDALKEEVEGVGSWNAPKGTTVDLGYHLFNHLKVDEKLPENIEAEFTRLANTIRALTLIYYKESSDGLNDLFRLFNGVNVCKTPEDVERYLFSIPYSLKHKRFTPCSIEESKENAARVYRSPALMGDRYFTCGVVDPKAFPKTLEGFEEWVRAFRDTAGVSFSKRPERVMKGDFLFPVLDKPTIEKLIKRMYETLESWEKTYEAGEREIMSIKELKNTFDELATINASEEVLGMLGYGFETLVKHNQNRLIELRSGVTRYLALEITALIQLVRLCIEAQGVE